jgi:hypothetical protein
MTITRKQILTQLRDLTGFFIASVIQAYLVCSRCNSWQSYGQVTIFTFLMWIILWKGNEAVSNWVDQKISWIKFPTKRLVIGIVSTIGYTLASVIALMWFFENVFGYNFGKGYVYTIYGAVIITIVISLFLHGREFLLFWKQAILDREKFEKETIAARYESLKNQVNPHFLFNSLNALTNLVYEDQEKAVKFIKQLSEVYRYVLDTRDQEVVSLNQEIKFLESYIYLQKIRFGEKLKINNEIPETDSFIAPLALQMLVENAIKHNVIAEDEPLTIRIFMADGYVCVMNNLQKKKMPLEPSAGVGLENIQRRYELLSDKKVEIRQNEKTFSVKIPEIIKASS